MNSKTRSASFLIAFLMSFVLVGKAFCFLGEVEDISGDRYFPAVPIAQEFMKGAKYAPRMVNKNAERAFDIYLFLLWEYDGNREGRITFFYDSAAEYLKWLENKQSGTGLDVADIQMLAKSFRPANRRMIVRDIDRIARLLEAAASQGKADMSGIVFQARSLLLRVFEGSASSPDRGE